MQAHDYLNPDNFKTGFDNLPTHIKNGHAEKQYRHGLETGQNAEYIYLRPVRDLHAWGAQLKNGSYVTAYETIGLHANTAALLRGFLDSGADIIITHWGDDNRLHRDIIHTKSGDIKPLQKGHPAF